MHNRVIQQFKGDGLKSNLMRGGLASIAIKIFGLGFSLLTVIILARTLGPEQYGVYSYVLAIVSILAIPAMFGLPTLIVRETAKAEVKQEWGLMRGLWSWANRITASLSLLIALISALVLWLNSDSFSQIQFLTFAWGIAFIPLSALAALRGASLRGLRKVIQGQLPEQVLKPALFIVMLAVVSLTGFTQLTAESAMMLNALSAGLAFVFGAWLLWRTKPKQLTSVTREYERKAWTSSVVPFAFLSGLAVIVTQTDIVMLGLMKTSADVGVYKVASQGAGLAALGIVAVSMVAMPYMSRLANSNDVDGLEKIVQKSARLSLFFSIIITALFAVIGDQLINVVFGSDYVVAYLPLLLLALGHVFHAGFGQGGILLNMCGYEKGTLITLILSALLNIVLNFMFIPVWGVHGAATATLISVLFRKLVIWTMVYIIYGIDSSALALRLRSKLTS
jgi:O-antigen/teichoic acid export membrane protein